MKSKKHALNTSSTPTLTKIKKIGSITEYYIPHNEMRVLFSERKGSGIVTSNIVYKVGARDEARGETGIAHMLEHMLFKPTVYDRKQNVDAASMRFERETGITLNANTWKDRTCYYFSYPKEYFERAVQIEAERMRDVVLNDEEFLPERTNVLSEFDMYAGDEEFALSVQMLGVALHSHPYGHETIGYREDIESYTVEKLNAFYKKYYAPNNATLIIVGDVSERDMVSVVAKYFSHIPKSTTLQPRIHIREPKQEGIRSVTIERPSEKQVYALGVLHAGFPSKEWFETMVIFEMLAGGEDSILHRAFVDTGRAVNIHASLEPTYEQNLGLLYITLSKKFPIEKIHDAVLMHINSLTQKDFVPYLKKTIAKTVTDELRTREHSLGFAQELVEYESAGAWEAFFSSEELLRKITTKDLYMRLQKLFAPQRITVGYSKGTK